MKIHVRRKHDGVGEFSLVDNESELRKIKPSDPVTSNDYSSHSNTENKIQPTKYLSTKCFAFLGNGRTPVLKLSSCNFLIGNWHRMNFLLVDYLVFVGVDVPVFRLNPRYYQLFRESYK